MYQKIGLFLNKFTLQLRMGEDSLELNFH